MARFITPERQRYWPQYVSAILWADRITVRSTTGHSPYYLVYGTNCVLPFDIEEDTWIGIYWDKITTIEELLTARAAQLLYSSRVREKAGLGLDDARLVNKVYYDRRARIRKEPLAEDDLVLLSNTRWRKRVADKFVNRWTGPYRIAEVCGQNVYRIKELSGDVRKDKISGNRLKRFFMRSKYSRPEDFEPPPAPVMS
ncbi:hypothetical protein DL89DRAFT_221903 [Linderina pennispora]|uniref:Uncharacterized protein n=1 Tax=Linderina pennispora TaxID=61395 RepID=A0A1Y1WD01_9FUNG|nr:uncharacterized protein DL89DRAFT_221903 [Linderina pennispora]ORX71116.1 hypothetical protein DL89DRAFT_221903 [Linderina pennispora]